ncbi:MAG: hypothetical protein JSU85_02465 [Candidatus Zixiibacteriota bacterium]|nr:MAG: hypothetical protein JSU85_02465 [candidate division Zixibacteria bacterium]
MTVKVSSLAERILTMRYRYRPESGPVNFSELSRDLKGCLVCMPSRLDLIKPAADVLPALAETFPDRNIKILLTSNIDPQSHEIIKKFIVIKPLAYDLDRFSLPKKNFIERIAEGGLAVAIDMDTAPNFFNAVIALKAGAVVRTAFDKGVGLPYYNFILGVPSAEAAPRVSYRALADILGNFKT